jgi:hypothetical protein
MRRQGYILLPYFRLMKHGLFAALVLLFLARCTKEKPEPSISAATALLTSKTWLYDEYYSGYHTAARKRVYKRNATGNSADFSVYQYLFKKDGSFEVKVGNESMYSTWRFIEGETEVEITNGSGPPTRLKVVVLQPTAFEWQVDDYYAKMIPR